MPVLPSSLALRMSAVVRTGITRSAFSRISFWLAAMLLTVAWKPSQTDTVQLAAVRPPLRMSSNSSRFHLAMISPSITMLSACNSAGLIRLSPLLALPAPNRLPALWGQHMPRGQVAQMQKRQGNCRKRQTATKGRGKFHSKGNSRCGYPVLCHSAERESAPIYPRVFRECRR
ncbi:hypothetical protein D3C81_925360 [compost metagenome]